MFVFRFYFVLIALIFEYIIYSLLLQSIILHKKIYNRIINSNLKYFLIKKELN